MLTQSFGQPFAAPAWSLVYPLLEPEHIGLFQPPPLDASFAFHGCISPHPTLVVQHFLKQLGDAPIQIERKDVAFQGKPRLFKLGLEAIRISLAQEYDPYFGLSISRVDPLPHQLDAVYNHLLKSARCRFLLADDAGAGKTIMAGLLLKELKLRGLVDRVLIVCPANLAFQWQRELADRFQETFHILRGGDLRVQYGVNLWNDKAHIITSMDLAKRDEILPSVRQADDWDTSP
jgi:SNF2 family DNA or RNA helicase